MTISDDLKKLNRRNRFAADVARDIDSIVQRIEELEADNKEHDESIGAYEDELERPQNIIVSDQKALTESRAEVERLLTVHHEMVDRFIKEGMEQAAEIDWEWPEMNDLQRFWYAKGCMDFEKAIRDAMKGESDD